MADGRGLSQDECAYGQRYRYEDEERRNLRFDASLPEEDDPQDEQGDRQEKHLDIRPAMGGAMG